MKIVAVKGINKKDLINVTSGEMTLKELAAVDSFNLYGGAIYETSNPVSGEIVGAVAVNTDLGLFTGVSKQVYNAIEGVLEIYTSKELKEGIPAKIVSKETDGDRAYLIIELL